MKHTIFGNMLRRQAPAIGYLDSLQNSRITLKTIESPKGKTGKKCIWCIWITFTFLFLLWTGGVIIFVWHINSVINTTNQQGKHRKTISKYHKYPLQFKSHSCIADYKLKLFFLSFCLRKCSQSPTRNRDFDHR